MKKFIEVNTIYEDGTFAEALDVELIERILKEADEGRTILKLTSDTSLLVDEKFEDFLDRFGKATDVIRIK